MKDFQTCRSAISQLREMGVEVSTDDFGAGFTSLAYLAKLEVSELKLDQSFANQLTVSSSSGLVRATVDLGHALGLRVLEEGVADGATLNLLTGVGCDLAQGYLIGLPVAADQVAPQRKEMVRSGSTNQAPPPRQADEPREEPGTKQLSASVWSPQPGPRLSTGPNPVHSIALGQVRTRSV